MQIQASPIQTLPPSMRAVRQARQRLGTYELRGLNCGALAVVLRCSRNVPIADRIRYVSTNPKRTMAIFKLIEMGRLA